MIKLASAEEVGLELGDQSKKNLIVIRIYGLGRCLKMKNPRLSNKNQVWLEKKSEILLFRPNHTDLPCTSLEMLSQPPNSPPRLVTFSQPTSALQCQPPSERITVVLVVDG